MHQNHTRLPSILREYIYIYNIYIYNLRRKQKKHVELDKGSSQRRNIWNISHWKHHVLASCHFLCLAGAGQLCFGWHSHQNVENASDGSLGSCFRHPLLAWTFYGPCRFSGKMAEFSTKFCKYGSCAVWSGLKRTISATDMSLTVECKLPPRSNRPWPILGCEIPRIWEQSKNLPSFTCPALSSKCVSLAGFEWIQAVLERASALSVILSCYSKWNLGTWVASLGTCKACLILGLLMHHGNSFGEHISMKFHQKIASPPIWHGHFQPPVTGWPTAMKTVGWVVLSTRWHFLSISILFLHLGNALSYWEG